MSLKSFYLKVRYIHMSVIMPQYVEIQGNVRFIGVSYFLFRLNAASIRTKFTSSFSLTSARSTSVPPGAARKRSRRAFSSRSQTSQTSLSSRSRVWVFYRSPCSIRCCLKAGEVAFVDSSVSAFRGVKGKFRLLYVALFGRALGNSSQAFFTHYYYYK